MNNTKAPPNKTNHSTEGVSPGLQSRSRQVLYLGLTTSRQTKLSWQVLSRFNNKKSKRSLLGRYCVSNQQREEHTDQVLCLNSSTSRTNRALFAGIVSRCNHEQNEPSFLGRFCASIQQRTERTELSWQVPSWFYNKQNKQSFLGRHSYSTRQSAEQSELPWQV